VPARLGIQRQRVHSARLEGQKAMDLSISPSQSRWQVEWAVHDSVVALKPAPFQPINIKDGVTDTHAKV
jgi:hypothetical protein